MKIPRQQVITLEHSSMTLTNTHEQSECRGVYCTIHYRSDHIMRGFPQHWREDRGLMERTCPHGVGHPDPDEYELDVNGKGVHGCDGCCSVGGWEILNGGNK